MERIKKVKATRDQAAVDKALARLRETARGDHPEPPRNILAEAVEAAKVRACNIYI